MHAAGRGAVPCWHGGLREQPEAEESPRVAATPHHELRQQPAPDAPGRWGARVQEAGRDEGLVHRALVGLDADQAGALRRQKELAKASRASHALCPLRRRRQVRVRGPGRRQQRVHVRRRRRQLRLHQRPPDPMYPNPAVPAALSKAIARIVTTAHLGVRILLFPMRKIPLSLALVIWHSNTWNIQVAEFYAARI